MRLDSPGTREPDGVTDGGKAGEAAADDDRRVPRARDKRLTSSLINCNRSATGRLPTASGWPAAPEAATVRDEDAIGGDEDATADDEDEAWSDDLPRPRETGMGADSNVEGDTTGPP